jgi:DNA-binding NarL/FixJ family response regulator
MPPRILIADDNPAVRTLVRRCCETEPGWEVCGEASNGKEAIEKARELHPDLIILDLSMPVMNGLEAATILRKLMPSVPLIMFTFFSTHDLERQALDAGVSKLILKTEPLQDLITAIRSLVFTNAA